MSFFQPHPPDGHAKMPIPRLDRPREPPPPKKAPAASQGRVSRACMGCRARKIKCNGKRPKCQNCTESATLCVYMASRKNRLKTFVPLSICSHLPHR
ncbi:hypothetical protein BU23DRAFT_553400 [Bimuria novae-zelandiae CBS 107.79]|uniref:Zn(2)-C6 fungal-type domain-containing protein n=1 Tax=Bimuria novae-zelandiae CBS 107.79 TaxID=1447943 RepID=A0A6A5VB00_9PLEO|nr:hypothetical protein BU23DRAFT_553400 [Bimuria novae-zelandiae CBS 107.79]